MVKLFILAGLIAAYGSLPELKLTAPNGGAGSSPMVVSLGLIEGAVQGPLQASVDGTPVSSQTDIKTRWPGGSIKHALVTFVPSARTAGSQSTVTFSGAASLDTTPISSAAILATDFDAKVVFTINDTDYTVSARDLIASGKFAYWMKGPLATELILRGKPKTVEGLATENVFVQMVIRFYQGLSCARVSFEIENVKKQHRQDTQYGVALSVGKTSSLEVFRQDSVKQFFMTRWRKIYHWGTVPSEFSVKYPLSYLISTGLVPRYDTTLIQSESRLAYRATQWSTCNKGIMGNGFISPGFGTTGARDEIGPLPRWTAEYLLSMDDRMRQVCLGHGDLSGSFSVHIRESDSVRTVSIWQYPTVTLMNDAAQWSDAKDKLPVPTGPCSTPFEPDGAHQPDFAYIPYLLSGDYYYLEEMYYWCTWNLLKYNFEYRKKEKGLISEEYDQVRGFGWVIRTMGEAAAIAPDADFEKGYYDSIVRYNLSFHKERLLGANPDNSLGVWRWWEFDGANACGPFNTTCVAPFEHDFVSISIDQLVNLGFVNAVPIRDFLLMGATERFRGDNGFDPACGTRYKLPTSSVVNQAYQPYTTWAEVYTGMGTSTTCQLEAPDCGQCYSVVARAALSAYSRTNIYKSDTAYRYLNSNIPRSTSEGDVTFALVPGPSRSVIGAEQPLFDVYGESVAVLRAYPNPANPTTKLELKIHSKASVVNAKIYTVSGKMVSQVALKRKGSVFSENWNTHGMSSGNYLIAIESGKNIITRKITLVK